MVTCFTGGGTGSETGSSYVAMCIQLALALNSNLMTKTWTETGYGFFPSNLHKDLEMF